MAKKNYPKRSMKDKYNFHAERAKNVPKGQKMTKGELNAYSFGYVKHARDSRNIYRLKQTQSGG